MIVEFNKKFLGSVILFATLLLSACAGSWPDPYAKSDPELDDATKIDPEMTEENVFETMPLPSSDDALGTPPPRVPAPQPVIKAEPELAAVVSLRGQAVDSMTAGEFELAAATLERALRIQPRNPVLWLDLAAVRFSQNELVQCESTAKRALTYAGTKRDISFDAWSLIANSRYARNDQLGGQRAEAEALAYR